jgi:hypothetical protein
VTAAPKDWLPAEAVERSAVSAAVEAVVAEWAAHWFVRGEFRLESWGLASPDRMLGEAGSRACGGGVEANCSTRAAARVAGLALDARAETTDLNERDRLLVSALARQIVDDLAQRLRRLGGREGQPPEAMPGARLVVASIAEGADVLFSLAIPLPLLLGVSRRTLPRPPAATKIEGERLDAVGRSTVRLEATLGTAILSLAEAKGLAPGDILLLDRTLGDAADLTFAQSPGVVARGVLTETEGQLALVLQTAQ